MQCKKAALNFFLQLCISGYIYFEISLFAEMKIIYTKVLEFVLYPLDDTVNVLDRYEW